MISLDRELLTAVPCFQIILILEILLEALTCIASSWKR